MNVIWERILTAVQNIFRCIYASLKDFAIRIKDKVLTLSNLSVSSQAQVVNMNEEVYFIWRYCAKVCKKDDFFCQNFRYDSAYHHSVARMREGKMRGDK